MPLSIDSSPVLVRCGLFLYLLMHMNVFFSFPGQFSVGLKSFNFICRTLGPDNVVIWKSKIALVWRNIIYACIVKALRKKEREEHSLKSLSVKWDFSSRFFLLLINYFVLPGWLKTKIETKTNPHNTPNRSHCRLRMETTFNIDNYNVFPGTATTTKRKEFSMKNRGRKIIITEIN